MVGECVRFLFTSCEELLLIIIIIILFLLLIANERASLRASEFAILHNKWIKIVQTNQPWSYLFIS